MDHIIYRDYMVNRRSFIYCSLAHVPPGWSNRKNDTGYRKLHNGKVVDRGRCADYLQKVLKEVLMQRYVTRFNLCWRDWHKEWPLCVGMIGMVLMTSDIVWLCIWEDTLKTGLYSTDAQLLPCRKWDGVFYLLCPWLCLTASSAFCFMGL